MQRLKTPLQFRTVLAGTTVSRTTHFALHRTPVAGPVPGTPSGSPGLQDLFPGGRAWIGTVVPKRWARRAVTRNTIKRQVYNVAQDYAALLPQAAHVVRLRAGFDRQQFISATSPALKLAVRTELQQLFRGALA